MLCRMPRSAEPRRRMRTHCPLLEISAPSQEAMRGGTGRGAPPVTREEPAQGWLPVTHAETLRRDYRLFRETGVTPEGVGDPQRGWGCRWQTRGKMGMPSSPSSPLCGRQLESSRGPEG